MATTKMSDDQTDPPIQPFLPLFESVDRPSALNSEAKKRMSVPNSQHSASRSDRAQRYVSKRTMSESMCQDSEDFSSDDEAERSRRLAHQQPVKRLDLASTTLNSLISPRAGRSQERSLYKKRSFSPWRLVTTCLRGNSLSNERPNRDQVTRNEKRPLSDDDLVRPMSQMPGFVSARSTTAEDSIWTESTTGSNHKPEYPFFRASRFSNVPPTVRFCLPSEKVERPKRAVRKSLRWCHNSLTPKVIRKCLATSHFEIVNERTFWLGYWGRHLKSSAYKHVLPYQKVNHFPGTFNLGRKDRLWGHISRMYHKYGHEEFDLMPQTYVLPKDIKRLKVAIRNGYAKHYILKPPASARGTGIRIIHKWRQVPRRQSVVAQHYIHRPFLINGNKFDLRLYVYVSSFNPLRLYLYEDGLVRFASVKYSNAVASMSNRFMHLTNYSINKTAVPEGESTTPCDKWTVKQLWQYLSERGYDVKDLMEKIVDVIIKSIISCESAVVWHIDQHIQCPYACHELFGFDILLDENLKPWLLEINISPSLHSGTDLDVAVKTSLARDLLNLAGIQIADKTATQNADGQSPCMDTPLEPYCADFRIKAIASRRHSDEKVKEKHYVQEFLDTGKVSPGIVEKLTASDLRVLIDTEDECDRRGQFTRLFPSPFSSRYLRFFDQPRYLNLLLDQWTTQYFHIRDTGCSYLERLCMQKVHQS